MQACRIKRWNKQEKKCKVSRFSSWLEGATGHQLPSRQRDSNTAGMNLTQGCFLNRESSTWAAAASIAQFTSRLPWRGCDRGCQERETQAKRCLQGAPSWDGRTHTGGKEKHRAGPCPPHACSYSQGQCLRLHSKFHSWKREVLVPFLSQHISNISPLLTFQKFILFFSAGIMLLCCKRFNSPGKKDSFKKPLSGDSETPGG